MSIMPQEHGLQNLTVFEGMEWLALNLPAYMSGIPHPAGIAKEFIVDVDSMSFKQHLRDNGFGNAARRFGGGVWLQMQSFGNTEDGSMNTIKPLLLLRTTLPVLYQTPELKKRYMNYVRSMWSAIFKFPFSGKECFTLGGNAGGGVSVRRGAVVPQEIPVLYSFDIYYEPTIYATVI